ncbi:hypothetical protein [Caldanaerobius polysaccharolyticus]|uniref:hypothetical protein n=1 Tax=Caldanaerobius polysaccharolyticus TaxID=44256 RepID=UPI00047E4329|nr:hypothetical protein [Caldanaerobius polysaccharolyticus]
MDKIYLERYNGYARYVCTCCNHCNSKMGISYCSVKLRGCCSYFPKFELIDVHRMVKSMEGLHVLERIVNNPGTVVYNYYLHATGYFDREGYLNYLKNAQEEVDVKDKSIFFRACPFVKSGYGCTLPPAFRNYVCNFFICDEVMNNVDKSDVMRKYIEERSRYARWVQWENLSLERMLRENDLDFKRDFDGTISFLQDIPLDLYEFPCLEEINILDEDSKGA